LKGAIGVTDSNGQSQVQQKPITMDDVNRVLDAGRILLSVLTDQEKEILSRTLLDKIYRPGQRIRLNEKTD
jgi:hypothetical protein